MREVGDPEARAALGLITTGLARLSATGASPVDAADAVAWIEAIEGVHRRVEQLQIDLLSAIDARNLNAADGHFSAKRMVEHHAGLSPTDASRRDRNRRMLAELGEVAAAFSSGCLSIAHAATLAKVFANTRAREYMAPAQQWFLDQASSLSFRDFDQVVRQWERLVDADGAADRNQRNHEARNATLVQDPFDLGWELRAQTASMVGAELAAVLDAYTRAEYEADWEKARAEHGHLATASHLPRTAAQRRHDALAQIFHNAANFTVGSVSVPTHNIVWSAETYEEVATALETGTTPRLDVATHRCSTLTGVPVEPVEAMVASLWARVRRVVVDASSVTIDLGTARFFTGSARQAVLVTNPRCIWPGCHTPADACQVDHLHEHQIGGRTSPGNGAPLCGRHNRHKHNHRYRIQRKPSGRYTVARPDGTLLE
jgi:hypothetical protein